MDSNLPITDIKARLEYARRHLLQTEKPKLVDYDSLSEKIMLDEYEQELRFLTGLIKSPEHFRQRLAQRCSDRANDPCIHAINFTYKSNSITNQLYRDVVQLAFPDNPLRVLCPTLNEVRSADIPDLIPADFSESQRKAYLRNPIPRLVFRPIETIQLDELDYFIFQNSQAFDVRSIESYSLLMHVELFQQLQTQNHELATVLYTHNLSLQVLKEDILLLQNKGQTLKELLTRLSRGLRLGGSAMTGNTFAGSSSQSAYLIFFDYLKLIPSPLLNQLYQLKGDKTLLQIIQWLRRGDCVESAASYIDNLLAINHNNPLLHKVLLNNPESIHALHTRYKREKIKVFKDSKAITTLPVAFLKLNLARFTLKTTEDLIIFLLNFPTSQYELLFTYAPKLLSSKRIGDLNRAIHYGFFTSEQIAMLLKTVADKTSLNKNVLFTTARCKPEAIILYLALIPAEERLKCVLIQDSHGYTVLHDLAEKPRLFKEALELIPMDQRWDALKVQNQLGQAVLLYAVGYPDSFIAGITAVPKSQHTEFTKLHDKQNRALVHYAAKHPQTMNAVRALYTRERLTQELLAKDKLGHLPIHSAHHNLGALEHFFDLHPQDELLNLLNYKTKQRETMLHLAADCTKTFTRLLNRYPENQQVAAIKATDAEGKSVLFCTVTNPENLKNALARYPENERLEAVLEQTRSDSNALFNARYTPDSLFIIFNLLPVNDRFYAAMAIDSLNTTVFHYVVTKPIMLYKLLLTLPENKRYEVLQAAGYDKRTVLHYAIHYPLSLQVIFHLLPLSDAFKIIREEWAIYRLLIEEESDRDQILFNAKNKRILQLYCFMALSSAKCNSELNPNKS